MVYKYYDNDSAKAAFSFKFSTGSTIKFSFDKPVSVPSNRSLKRRRALSDVDGDGNKGRKKRRLRFIFCTSRLSRPFSQPASNIVNRGVGTKIAIWGNRRALGRNLLRKAAIMNRVRLRMDAAKEYIRQQELQMRETLALREIVVPKPRHESPLPLSPLGLSNYDALDLEDELFDVEHQNGIDRASNIYSDFNNMSAFIGNDDYDYLDALDGVPHDLLGTPPPPLEESIVEMLREKERQGDSYFVHPGGQ